MDEFLPRLLVCDDDPGVIEGYKIVLESMGKEASAQKLFRLRKVEEELFGNVLLPDYRVEWNIDYVMSGEEAVANVRKAIGRGNQYSAVFMDVRMPPGIDGREAARQICEIDPNIHVIIITGYSDYTIEDFDSIAGPDQRLTFMMKPVWPDQLRSVVRELSYRVTDATPSTNVLQIN